MIPMIDKKLRIPIALDSGAYSIYSAKFAPKKKKGSRIVGDQAAAVSNFEYAKSKEFREYLDDYMEFLHDFGHCFHFYATLDVIFNPKATWEIYQEMRRNGLNPIPVFHYGEDRKWLHKMMDETDYIGLGGLGQAMTKAKFIPFADGVFRDLCDKKGRPLWRVHGFAVASFELLMRYPWHTVDSTTSRIWANFGQLMIPRYQFTGYNFLVTPYGLPVSPRRGLDNRHIEKVPELVRKECFRYVREHLGFKEKAVVDDHWTRAVINYYFMNNNIRALIDYHRHKLHMPDYQLYYYASGITEGGIWRTIDETWRKLQSVNATSHLRYLGTFFKGQGRHLVLRLLEEQYGNYSGETAVGDQPRERVASGQ